MAAAVVGGFARRIGLVWHHRHSDHKETCRRSTQSEKKKNKKTTTQKKKIFTLFGGVQFELDKKYAPRDVLGNGKYGVVCSCINLETNDTVAIKKIVNPFRNSTTARRTLRETQILRRVGPHDNIISLKDVMLSSSDDDIYLVQELMDYDLGHIIKSAPAKLLSDGHVKYVMFQILRGIKFLHSANVMHRDLKPQNILVNKNWKVKICDFGLARTTGEGPQKMTANIGTRSYMAPELLTGDVALYGNGVDMWSAGCILAEMLGGTQPEEPLAADLLRRMLVVEPEQRISASEALEHPYFSGAYDPVRDGSAPTTVSLEVDQNPGGADEKMIKELLRKEMLFYHPEDKTN